MLATCTFMASSMERLDGTNGTNGMPHFDDNNWGRNNYRLLEYARADLGWSGRKHAA
jgi:hypothetical protein